MNSRRFGRAVRITRHASERMRDRGITEELLFDLIETGTVRHKDDIRLWIFKIYPDRDDNLICAAAVLEDEVIIKTVMHHFELKENEP
jgi:hypothetical protein